MNILAALAFGETYRELAKITHPGLKNYAESIGAQFVNLDTDSLSNYEYERAIIVHSDIIIRPDTPSLFDVVPKEWIGTFNVGTQQYDLDKFAGENKKPEPKPWGVRWYSTGIVVADRKTLEYAGTESVLIDSMLCHLLTKVEHIHNEAAFNYYLNQYTNHDKILDIGPRFNRMPYFEEFSNHYSRFEFYIMHYSQLLSLMGIEELKKLIQDDLKIWDSLKDKHYHIPRPLIVHVGGGLGDQVCAEPVIRELRRLYPHDHLFIENHWPELWENLNGYQIEGVITPGSQPEYPVETLHFYTYGNPDTTIQKMGMTHSNMSSTDLTSYLILNRPLPPEKREIKIGYTPENTASMLSKLECTEDWLQSAIILHPGLTWPTRTIPENVWLELIQLLLQDQNHIVLIGQGGEYQGPGRVEKIGVLDFEAPLGVIDARNKLTVKETISLLDHSDILVSNDSSPIHLAGATDIWILGIFTTKHPYFVLPFRNGSCYWKTQAINSEPACWPCGVDAIKSFPEGLRVDLCKNYKNPYCCQPSATEIYNQINKSWIRV